MLGVVAGSLAVASFLHLHGDVRGRSKPFSADGAGVAYHATVLPVLAWSLISMRRT